jgi:hypothetical protein
MVGVAEVRRRELDEEQVPSITIEDGGTFACYPP